MRTGVAVGVVTLGTAGVVTLGTVGVGVVVVVGLVVAGALYTAKVVAGTQPVRPFMKATW